MSAELVCYRSLKGFRDWVLARPGRVVSESSMKSTTGSDGGLGFELPDYIKGGGDDFTNSLAGRTDSPVVIANNRNAITSLTDFLIKRCVQDAGYDTWWGVVKDYAGEAHRIGLSVDDAMFLYGEAKRFSKASAYWNEDEFEKKWNDPGIRNGCIKGLFRKGQDLGWKNPGSDGNEQVSVTPLQRSKLDKPQSVASLFEDLELRQEDVNAMAEADILFPGMIVRGHVQAYVSPANGGKTTIMVYICEDLTSKGLQVFYINVDGSPGDLKRHHEHAKQHGYKLIAPDARQGGSAKLVLEKMYQLAESDQKLDEYIFIFDTLKKFVQVIDKSKAAEFFKLMRSLSVKGATIILLGHTNKHKDEEGNTIFEGTGDLRNDVDELIYLDSFKNETDGTLEVTTRPDKVRAELEPRTFIIDLKNGRKVSECGYVKKILAKEQREVLELFKEAIHAGCASQTELLDYVEPKTTQGRGKLRTMLIEFTRWDAPEIIGGNTGRGKDLKYSLAGGAL